jgi:hypothetical protein
MITQEEALRDAPRDQEILIFGRLTLPTDAPHSWHRARFVDGTGWCVFAGPSKNHLTQIYGATMWKLA